MPIYEYKCKQCSRLTSQLVRKVAEEIPPSCQHCGGATTRALSRFATPKSESRVLADYGAMPRGVEDYKDPRQIGRWAERKFDEFGMEMPREAREMIDAAREGDFPDPVKDL